MDYNKNNNLLNSLPYQSPNSSPNSNICISNLSSSFIEFNNNSSSPISTSSSSSSSSSSSPSSISSLLNSSSPYSNSFSSNIENYKFLIQNKKRENLINDTINYDIYKKPKIESLLTYLKNDHYNLNSDVILNENNNINQNIKIVGGVVEKNKKKKLKAILDTPVNEEQKYQLIQSIKSNKLKLSNLNTEQIQMIDPKILSKMTKHFCSILFDNNRIAINDLKLIYKFQLDELSDRSAVSPERYECQYENCNKNFVCKAKAYFNKHLLNNHFDFVKNIQVNKIPIDNQKHCDHTGCKMTVSKLQYYKHIRVDHHLTNPYEVDKCPRCISIKQKVYYSLSDSINQYLNSQ